jgi:hypothetical protein
MRCEEVLIQLPDYALGTLSDVEEEQVRRHLRGCAACRHDAATLDEGLAMFSSAAHAIEPPPELAGRVMAALSDEWNEALPDGRRGFRVRPQILAIAAAVIALAGTLAWGVTSHIQLGRYRTDAVAYREFLGALGGKDVRVARLEATGQTVLEGSAVVYDGDEGQSWVLVLVRAPGYSGKLSVTISSPGGRLVKLFPIEIDLDGEGATWLVTSADITRFAVISVATSGGDVLATGTASEAHPH